MYDFGDLSLSCQVGYGCVKMNSIEIVLTKLQY